MFRLYETRADSNIAKTHYLGLHKNQIQIKKINKIFKFVFICLFSLVIAFFGVIVTEARGFAEWCVAFFATHSGFFSNPASFLGIFLLFCSKI